MPTKPSRRRFLKATTSAAASTALLTCASANEETSLPEATADSCIFLWLGGGACHIDTWDPKRKGDAKAKKAGSYYEPIDTAIDGIQVCEHLPRMAKMLDRTIIMRSCHHEVIDEHAAAVNRVHVGRPPTGTTIYPSIGAVASHELGARGAGIPAYVVMGYPSASRGPGFLGSQHSYLYLTETELGPAGLKRPVDVTDVRQQRREAMLAILRKEFLDRNRGQKKIEDYVSTSVQGLKLAGPKFMSVFDIKSEHASVRESYGGEFGQRCLLARRLVQEGVRFVEVSLT